MSDKKVAMLLCGGLRTYKKCHDTIVENVIKPNDSDVFICCGNEEINSDLWHMYDGRVKDIDFLPCYASNTRIINQILNRTPKAIHERVLKGNVQQLVKLYHCYRMMLSYEEQKNIKYDVVIRCRPDLWFFEPVRHEIYNLEQLQVWHDFFAIGNRYDMARYCDSILFFGIYSDGPEDTRLPRFACEIQLWLQLDNCLVKRANHWDKNHHCLFHAHPTVDSVEQLYKEKGPALFTKLV
jgi:hypothetical protein